MRPRSLRLKADIRHETPAYLGEHFPIVVDVTNEDEVEIEVFLDILLQPGDDDSRTCFLCAPHTPQNPSIK